MTRRKSRLNIVSQHEHPIRARLRNRVSFALHAYNQLITLDRDTALVAVTGMPIELVNALQAQTRAIESHYVQKIHPSVLIDGPDLRLFFNNHKDGRSWPQTALSLPAQDWDALLGTHRPRQITEAAVMVVRCIREARTAKPSALHFLCPEMALLVKAMLDEIAAGDPYDWDIDKPVPKRNELANLVRAVRPYADVFSELAMVPPNCAFVKQPDAKTKDGGTRSLAWTG